MKIITLPVATRPYYLKQLLNTLKDNNLEGWKLYINSEPYEEVIKVVRSINFIETNILINKTYLGVRQNPFNVIDRAFDAGAEYVVHLEDDLIISPDLLDLAMWYYESFKDNPTKYLNYGFFNYDSDTDLPDDIIEVTDKFTGLGWSTFKECWYKWFYPNWFNDQINRQVWGPQTVGWDWSMASIAKTEYLKSLQPLCSRSNHIGRLGGTYCAAKFHDDTFPQIQVCQEDAKDLKYRIVND